MYWAQVCFIWSAMVIALVIQCSSIPAPVKPPGVKAPLVQRTGPPIPRQLQADYNAIKTERKIIFLTFDAHEAGGNQLAGARKLLLELRQRQIRATLFLTANFMLAAPDIVHDAIRDGHEIGSHLKTHITPAQLRRKRLFSEQWFKGELLAPAKILKEQYGTTMKGYFRMPFGLGDYSPGERELILKWAREEGYIHISWTIDCLDWVTQRGKGYPYLNAAGLKVKILQSAVSKDTKPIILAHLVRYRPESASGPVELVALLDEDARRAGFTFGRIGDFIGADSELR